MKTKWLKFIILSCALFVPAQLWAQSGVDVVVNESVSVDTLDKAAIKDILLGKTTYWPNGQAVNIVVLADKTDAALQEVTAMSASQFKTHWQRIVFSGRGQLPKTADSEEKLLSLIAANKGAISLVPTGTFLKNVKKIELKP